MQKKILIVLSDYYKDISQNLLKGATDCLKSYNTKIFELKYEVKIAPGSFEIPFIINRNIESYDGFISLGCIIRGETYHFELIANECSRSIMNISIQSNKPIGFGILTCENITQAIERSEPNKKNKGKEAALACLKLLE